MNKKKAPLDGIYNEREEGDTPKSHHECDGKKPKSEFEGDFEVPEELFDDEELHTNKASIGRDEENHPNFEDWNDLDQFEEVQ